MILTTILLSSAITYTTIRDQVYFEASKYGIEPELVLAIIKTESNFNPKAVGRSHKERGLMQLRPTYFKASFEPSANIQEGVEYLAKVRKLCYSKYGEAWFVCYNTGSNRTLEFVKLSNYYQKVKVAYVEQKKQSSIYRMCSSRSSSKFCNQAVP